jgi:hypothetical protein
MNRAAARIIAGFGGKEPPMLAVVVAAACLAPQASPEDLARRHKDTHRFSTLFTAQNVRDLLSADEGIRSAVDWCRRTAVTRVYVESFRDGYQAESAALKKARDRFAEAGLEVSGCVTPTGVGRRSTGWNVISCYTDRATQEKVQAIFEYVAGHFDEVMIDDFWFTDCACPECGAARASKTVRVGEKTYPVPGDTWADYRCELMVQVSRDRVIAPAKRANPKARLIIKYPQWYDRFHERGYEVVRQTADFDRTWVGTETRDYSDKRWGGTPQYEAYFIMRWLGGLGGAKCGGGWYDPYGTTGRTYVEQARQTILAGARESLLFCYGSLLKDTGPENIEALRENLADLFAAAAEVARREPAGVAAYKPPNSDSGGEPRVYDFVGMMGIPLAPCHEFPADAPAAFFPAHAAKDPALAEKLASFIASGKPVLVTDGLAKLLGDGVKLGRPNVRVLEVKKDPKSLLAKPQAELDALRAPLLKPFGIAFRAPNRVGLYLFRGGSRVVENFNDEPAEVEVDGKTVTVPERGWVCTWK